MNAVCWLLLGLGSALFIGFALLKYASMDYDPDAVANCPEYPPYPTRPIGKSSFCEIRSSGNPGFAQGGISGKPL